ncbi:MAG: type VI secretion system-associated protein TagF, partial [Myxococcales bacterium]
MGKIAQVGDFLRFGTVDEPVPAFESWVEHGMAHGEGKHGAVWQSLFAAGPIHAFVFRPQRQAPHSVRALFPMGRVEPGVLVGVLKPSQDAVGRKFPFAVYASVPERALAAAPHVVPIALGAFLDAATRVLLDGEHCGAADTNAAVGSLEPPRLEDAGDAAREYEHWTRSNWVGAVWSAIFGNASPPQALFVLQTMLDAVAPFRGQEQPSTKLALRLPLGPAGAAAAAFWLDAIRRI